MAFTITKDAGKITNKGGGVLKIWEVNEDGSIKSPMTVVDLGYVQDSDFTDTTPSENISDETLETVITVLGNREVMLSGNLLQSGLQMLELLDETRGKFFGAYKKFADLDGYHEELFLGRGTVTPSISLKAPNPRTNYEIKFSKLDSAVTYDSTACTLIGASASSAVIPANGYWVAKRTAIV